MATAALYALAALFPVKALAILTLTDHLVLEAAISTIDRDTALQTMVEIALAMA
jgi:purine-nucleoside phosphorylase